MSWATLLNRNVVKTEPTSKSEIDNLRSLVDRCLQDASVSGLSQDARFVLAYDAARSLSKMLVRAEGYRPASIAGHYNTFLALAEVDASFVNLSAYFDGCRINRNHCEYDFAGRTSETDADGLLEAVRKFAADVEAWLASHHPHLV